MTARSFATRRACSAVTQSGRFTPGVALTVAASLVLLAGQQAKANGFAIVEQSASVAGYAAAGAAALGEDASAQAYNPALLTELKGVTALTGVGIIWQSTDFDDDGSRDATGGALSGSQVVNGQTEIVPSFFASAELSDGVVAGLGIFSPFGQSVDYTDGWIGRYQAVESDLQTINIAPAIAARVTDWLSVGVAGNLLYADATRVNAIDFGSICVLSLGAPACGGLGLTPQQNDGDVDAKLDDWATGFTAGVLFKPLERLSVGLSYRSKFDVNLEGDVDFDVPPEAAPLTAGGTLFQDGNGVSRLDFPEQVSLSTATQVTEALMLLTDVTWTRWSRNDEISIEFKSSTQPDIVESQNWDDTYRFAVGARYAPPSDLFVLRGGLAFDQSPVSDDNRTAGLPVGDRLTLALGAGWRPEPGVAFDFSYSYAREFGTDIDQSSATAGTLTGDYDREAHTLGLQVLVSF